MRFVSHFINRKQFPNFLLKVCSSRNMTNKVTNCCVQPVGTGYRSLVLPDNEIVYIGRNRQACIADTIVSKKHLALKANYNRNVVECVCEGVNISGCNGYALKKNVTYSFKHGDRLEVLLGKFIYEIVFDYAEPEEGPSNKKIKLDDDTVSDQQSISIPDKINGNWQFIENSMLIYTPDDIQGDRVAAFDMDGTLIKTKSGQRFPKDKNDWILAFGNISQKLKDLYLQKYRIVIFSNQSKLGQEKHMVAGFKEKIENVVRKIGIPIQVFLATQKDIFRKPALGMWDNLLMLMDENINMDKSFYVGDAAGRAKNWAPHKNKDHSIADRLFALNIGIKFYTPEEYFLGAKSVPHAMPEFDPGTVTSFVERIPLSATQEAVIMVGCQGSGKTHFCKNNLVTHGYVYINRDTLGTKQKCLGLMEECLKTKKSFVVDNTNPDVESRKSYIDLCKKYQVPCKCFHMDVPHKQCKHNNIFRSLIDKARIPISDLLINSYKKKFQEPTLDEGFTEVHKFKFNAIFKNNQEEKLYKIFLLEL